MYGSGLRERILAATAPNNWLSVEVKVMIGFLPFSESVSTFTSVGISKITLCEKPSANSNFCPELLAR